MSANSSGRWHTCEPWWMEGKSPAANGNMRVMGAECTPVAVVPEHQKGDGDRIVAAVNACAGIPTSALESGVVVDLMWALEEAIAHIEAMGDGAIVRQLQSVVDKARGA